MLPNDRKFARFALHRSVPHMRSAHWSYQINLLVLLQNGKDGILLGVWRRNARVLSLLFGTLWFICWIELQLVARLRKMRRDSLKIYKRNGRSGLPERYERFHVCLKHGALRPGPERLIDVGINASRRDI